MRLTLSNKVPCVENQCNARHIFKAVFPKPKERSITMKKFLSVILSAAMALSSAAFCLGVSADTPRKASEILQDFASGATVVASPADFLALGKSGSLNSCTVKTDYMSASPVSVHASENMPFSNAIKITCHTPASSWTQNSVTWSISGNALPDGTTGLLKFTAKSETSGLSMAATLWSSAMNSEGSDARSGRRIDGTVTGHPVDGAWNTYYFPFTSCTGLTSLIMKTYKTAGTIYLADMELICFGTSVTEAALASALEGADGAQKIVLTSSYQSAPGDFYTICVPAETAEPEVPDEPEVPEEPVVTDPLASVESHATVVASPSDFLAFGNSGGITSAAYNASFMTRTKVNVDASERMSFTEAINLTCVTKNTGNWTQQSMSYNLANTAFAAGDTGLFRFSAKSMTTGEKMACTLWSSNANKAGDAQQGRRFDGIVNGNPEEGVWNTYYYPFTACTDLTSLVIKTTDVGTLLFADMEMINYGTSVTEAQLDSLLAAADGSSLLTLSGTGGSFHCYKIPTPLTPLAPVEPDAPTTADGAIDNLIAAKNAEIVVSPASFNGLAKNEEIGTPTVSTDIMSVSKVSVDAVDNMRFNEAVKISCVQPSLASTWINCFYKVGLYKADFNVGDVCVLRYTAKSDGSSGNGFAMRLFNAVQPYVDAFNQNTTYAVSDSWQSYFFPFVVSGEIGQIVMRTSKSVQDQYIGNFEIVNFGSSVTLDELKALISPFATTTVDKTGDLHYVCPPALSVSDPGEDEPDVPDEPVTDKDMLINDSYFINHAVAANSNTAITAADFTATEKLPFEKTLVASSNAAGSIAGASVVCNVNPAADASAKGDTVYLSFYARALEKSNKLRVCIQSAAGANVASLMANAGITYYPTTQWSRYYLPVELTAKVEKVAFQFGEQAASIEIAGVQLENLGKDTGTGANKLTYKLPQGSYLMEDFQDIRFNYEATPAYSDPANNTVGTFVEKSALPGCYYVCENGDYLYAIYSGKFYIINKNTDRIVGSYTAAAPDSLGSNTRQLRVSDDGNVAVISSREAGCFIMDCSDKTHPVLASRYDSIEYATGACIDGTMAYFTNRVFGVDCVDISDPYNPECVAVIRSGEGQSCEVDNGILYIGCWGGRCIEVWDVHQPSNPICIYGTGGTASPIDVDGLGDGFAVHDGYLYAATGQCGRQGTTFNAPGWAQGNGLVIYDIHDIRNPKWVATAHCDSRHKVTGQDYWEAKVSEFVDEHGDTRIYCYLTNTYLGLQVYDVTDPYAPIRLARVSYPVSTSRISGQQSTQVNNGTDRYFPYLDNGATAPQSPIFGVAVTDDAIYVGAYYAGLAKLETPLAHALTYSVHGCLEEPCGGYFDLTKEDLDRAGFVNARYAHIGGQVMGASESEGLIYAACGLEGIKILDSELNVLKTYKNGYCISDIAVSEKRTVTYGGKTYNKVLIVAEGSNGMTAYGVAEDGTTIVKLSNYLCPHGDLKSVRLSPNHYYAISDAGQANSELVDLTNLTAIKRADNVIDPDGVTVNKFTGGLVYKRQVVNGLVGGNKTGAYTHQSQLKIFEFDPKSDGTEGAPRVYNILKKGLNISQYGGMAALDDGSNKMVATLAGGYVIFDLDNTYSDQISLNSNTTSLSAFQNQTVPTTDPNYKVFKATYTGSIPANSYGKPIISGNTMFLSDINSGLFAVVDITDLYHPNVLMSYKFKANPYISCITDNHIIVPLGYQGIMRLDIPQCKDAKNVELGLVSARPTERENFASPGHTTVKDASGDTVYYALEENDSIGEVIKVKTSLVPGSYTLRYEKNGYLDFTTSFTVGSSDAEFGPFTLSTGDIIENAGDRHGDGAADLYDFVRVIRGFGSDVSASDKQLVDINEDGLVNVADLFMVKAGMAS